jgi:hypothetical protein
MGTFATRATIVRILSAALLSSLALHHPVSAQTPPPADGGAFCDLAGEDLIRSLEGSWSLDQAPGSVLYPLAQPLPDQPPIAVRFTWNDEEKVMDAVAADLSDEMILFPAAGEEREQAEEWVEVGADGSTAEGCAWSTTPVVVGTNWYFSGADEMHSWAVWREYCSIPENAEWIGPQCAESPPPGGFEMTMTLILRFQTSDYGAGAVFFEGSTEVEGSTYRFGAQAPVTIARN